MAVTLTIDNSYSRVEGLNAKQFNELRKILSYKIDTYGSFPRTAYCIDKKGNFPSGLADRVRRHLLAKGIGYGADFRQQQPTIQAPQKWQGPAPYAWQEDAADSALGDHRGIISATTGTGKSLLIALIASRLNVKTLVVVPTLELKRQLTEAVAAFKVNNVTVENIDSKRLRSLKHYDCLIIDECHHSAAKTYRQLNKTAWNSIYYRFCLTATPFRNNNEEQLLFEGLCGNIIYQLSYLDAVSEGYIVPVEAFYVDLPKTEIDSNSYAEVYSKLVVHNDHRNQVIADIMTNLDSAGKSTICLVKEVAHGQKIQALTGYRFSHSMEPLASDFLQDFNNRKITSLIGTTGLLGEGVDSKPATYIVIAGLGKAKSHFMQQVGRGVRRYKDKESCKIILFRDKSHKYTLRHYREQVKILKEVYNVVPQKLEI